MNMTTTTSTPVPLDVTELLWMPDQRMYCQEESSTSLRGTDWRRRGILLCPARTDQPPVTFHLTSTLADGEGDVAWWTLTPTTRTGFQIRIYNG